MTASGNTQHFDAIVVGAGFAGLYQLHRLRGMGLRCRVLEAGDGVGGTWFWNRYPGARCDVESFDYSYSFSPELEQEWSWSEHYASQPEILRYLNHVADRFDLRRDIQLGTRVEKAVFDEGCDAWSLTTTAGERFECRYLVMATGSLSKPQKPEFAGLDEFRGDWHHSADWPVQGVDFEGKRVGLIGTGSSGVQMVPVIAQQARHLTVFQRTANFSVPAQNAQVGESQQREVKRTYRERRAFARRSLTGQYLPANRQSALEVSPEARETEFETRWGSAGGGFRMLRAFSDLMVDAQANAYAADFVRAKIRAAVSDPAKAVVLSPKDDLPMGAKRLCVDTGYYEAFNRSNVTLVDASAHPIERITPTGLRAGGVEHEIDVLVFATGFDALTGALLAIDIRGRGGRTLRQAWAQGPMTYLGLMTHGFPNMFIVAGPGSPSVLSNMVHSIETHVDWISDCVASMQSSRRCRIEAAEAAQGKWVAQVNEMADRTLYPRGRSWYLGANVPGKPRVFMPYVAGVPAYRQCIEEVAAQGYVGFELS